MSILKFISEAREKKQHLLAVLIDPDTDFSKVEGVLGKLKKGNVDIIFVGGSLLYNGRFDECIELIRKNTNLPICIFPGSEIQMSKKVDALLFLSLISGRNPELLIGKHVTAAPILKQMNIEVISTAYMLIDGGRETTASYISQTSPIPADKPGIAYATALAGEYLGMKLIYLDAGSGANNPVSQEMIKTVRENVNLPIIVGGGIKTKTDAENAWNAGADVIVVGNILEKNSEALLGLKS